MFQTRAWQKGDGVGLSASSTINARDAADGGGTDLRGPSGGRDGYATDTGLYRRIRGLSKLRGKDPAMADGAQISRYADAGEGIYAFSRIDPGTGRE